METNRYLGKMAIVFPIDVTILSPLMKKNRNSIGLAERAQVSFTHSTATTSSFFLCFVLLLLLLTRRNGWKSFAVAVDGVMADWRFWSETQSNYTLGLASHARQILIDRNSS